MVVEAVEDTSTAEVPEVTATSPVVEEEPAMESSVVEGPDVEALGAVVGLVRGVVESVVEVSTEFPGTSVVVALVEEVAETASVASVVSTVVEEASVYPGASVDTAVVNDTSVVERLVETAPVASVVSTVDEEMSVYPGVLLVAAVVDGTSVVAEVVEGTSEFVGTSVVSVVVEAILVAPGVVDRLPVSVEASVVDGLEDASTVPVVVESVDTAAGEVLTLVAGRVVVLFAAGGAEL